MWVRLSCGYTTSYAAECRVNREPAWPRQLARRRVPRRWEARRCCATTPCTRWSTSGPTPASCRPLTTQRELFFLLLPFVGCCCRRALRFFPCFGVAFAAVVDRFLSTIVLLVKMPAAVKGDTAAFSIAVSAPSASHFYFNCGTFNSHLKTDCALITRSALGQHIGRGYHSGDFSGACLWACALYFHDKNGALCRILFSYPCGQSQAASVQPPATPTAAYNVAPRRGRYCTKENGTRFRLSAAHHEHHARRPGHNPLLLTRA